MTVATESRTEPGRIAVGEVGRLVVLVDAARSCTAPLIGAAFLAGPHTRASVLCLGRGAEPQPGLETVRSGLRRLGLQDWPVAPLRGPAAAACEAALGGHPAAGVVVVGIGNAGSSERLLAGEIALQVARVTGVPVLAVPPDAAPPFERAVVAVDFAEASLQTAREAAALLQRGSAWLVHVTPDLGFPVELLLDWELSLEERIARRFVDLIGRLAELAPDVHVRSIPLTGDPADQVLGFGRAARADLIALQRRGPTFLERIHDPGFAPRVLRRTTVCVLLLSSTPETV